MEEYKRIDIARGAYSKLLEKDIIYTYKKKRQKRVGVEKSRPFSAISPSQSYNIRIYTQVERV